MNRISGFVVIVLVLLTAGILVAGCADSAPAKTSTVQTTAITTTAATTALYTAGDIVRSPKAGAETGYLIIKYDSGADSYERAFIYRNNDGSWGYRIDARTETLGRSVLEKVNTVKVTQVNPSTVPIRQSSVTALPVTAGTASTAAATTAPVTTGTPAMKPQVKDITPDSGKAGTSVSITDLQGNGFQSGASVKLAKLSSTDIPAANVNVLSPSHISCTFSIPANATVGIWDLVVTNPDGQSTRYSNVFTVRVNTNPTVTTTSSSTGGIGITSIDPTSAFSGDYKQVTVYGSNFKDGITCKLTKSGIEILSPTVSRTSEVQMQCFFQIPPGSNGAWNLVLTNTDTTTGTLTNAFTVTG
jgi:hypothetical protein